MDINWLSLLDFFLGFICLLVALAGTILPVIPGLPIAWLGFLIFGILDKWQHYGLKTMLAILFLVVIVTILDSLAGTLGAKKFGASKAGMIGSFLGAIIGVIVFSLPGLILGTFLGAVILEYFYSKKNSKEAFSAGTGALLGFLAGSLFKIIISTSLIGIYFYLFFSVLNFKI